MEQLTYIIANYIKLLGLSNEVLENMVRDIENHYSYPSLRSISDCFDNWQVTNDALIISKLDIYDFNEIFLAHLNNGEEYFVLVFQLDKSQILYLHPTGEIVKDSIEEFSKKWDGIVFRAQTNKLSGIKKVMGAGEDNSVTLAKIRKVAFNQEEPITYKFFRNFSIFFSYWFIRIGITSNVITFMWFCLLITASYFFSRQSYIDHLIAAFLIILHFILDCCDGEVARVTRKSSRSGSIFEQVIHWCTNIALIVGISLGIFKSSNNANMLILGLFVLAFDTCFYYVYIQFNFWMNKDTNYGIFHSITRRLYIIMPVNILIFLLGAFINKLDYALAFWGIMSCLMFFSLTFLFFKKEFYYK